MAVFKRRASPAQSGSGEPMYLPRPRANMSAVLSPFWDVCAHRREAGMNPDEAVDESLTEPMLRAGLDQQLSAIEPFDGREIKGVSSNLAIRRGSSFRRCLAGPIVEDCASRHPVQLQAHLGLVEGHERARCSFDLSGLSWSARSLWVSPFQRPRRKRF